MGSIWVTLGPIVIINGVLLVYLLIFLFTREKWPVPDEVKSRPSSRFLNSFFKEWWYWINTPIARLLIGLRLSPNIITFIGFALACVAAYLFKEGAFGYAGWTMIFGATFDMFDGKVARMTGQVSRSGAYYDSVMDRFGEGVVMLGLAAYFGYSWVLYIVVAGLIGSMLVSYTRARGEGVGVVCKKGWMQRPERIAYLGVASVFQPMADYFLRYTKFAYVPLLVVGALLLIAVLTNITAIYRMVYIMNKLDNEDRSGSADSIPQILMKLSTQEGRLEWFEKMRQRHHLK
jgi:phosphatidylglycerophosphate synthase